MGLEKKTDKPVTDISSDASRNLDDTDNKQLSSEELMALQNRLDVAESRLRASDEMNIALKNEINILKQSQKYASEGNNKKNIDEAAELKQKLRELAANCRCAEREIHLEQLRQRLDILQKQTDNCNCAQKDEKIKELTQRICEVNSKLLDVTLSQYDNMTGIDDGEVGESEENPIDYEGRFVSVENTVKRLEEKFAKKIQDMQVGIDNLKNNKGLQNNRERVTSRRDYMPSGNDAFINNQKTAVYEGKVSPRILLLGDSHFRNMRSVAVDVFGSSCAVQSIFKPNARFGGVVSNISDLVKTYSKSDFVFVCAGANDILRGLTVKRREILNVIRSTSNTNLIFLSVPYSRDNIPYNRLAYAFNCELYDVVSAMESSESVQCIDVNQLVVESDMARDGLHLRSSGKFSIMKYMFKVITDTKYVDFFWEVPSVEPRHVCFDNLIAIETSDSKFFQVLPMTVSRG